ncbi:MAG: flagellar FlbD family protein [Ilumatobacteraceae bacterium]
MIRLTRLRQTDPLYLNPDHIERLEHHHETVVRLLNGNEYVVCESPDEIVDQVVMLRARSIALAARSPPTISMRGSARCRTRCRSPPAPRRCPRCRPPTRTVLRSAPGAEG